MRIAPYLELLEKETSPSMGHIKEDQVKAGSSFVIPVELRSAIELTHRFMI